MAKLKGVPIVRQFREMYLWRRVQRYTKDQVANAYLIARREKSLRNGNANRIEDSEECKSSPSLSMEQSLKFQSVKNAHMRFMTNEFATELDAIREKEQLDAEGVQFLIKCLEQGAELFAATDCRDASKNLKR